LRTFIVYVATSGDGGWSRDDISPRDLISNFGIVNLLNEALAHQAGGNKPGPVLVHSHQELFAAIVNKTNAGEIDQDV